MSDVQDEIINLKGKKVEHEVVPFKKWGTQDDYVSGYVEEIRPGKLSKYAIIKQRGTLGKICVNLSAGLSDLERMAGKLVIIRYMGKKDIGQVQPMMDFELYEAGE